MILAIGTFAKVAIGVVLFFAGSVLVVLLCAVSLFIEARKQSEELAEAALCDQSIPRGAYLCGCAWRGEVVPHYCPKHGAAIVLEVRAELAGERRAA
jgi:hypothetical protein